MVCPYRRWGGGGEPLSRCSVGIRVQLQQETQYCFTILLKFSIFILRHQETQHSPSIPLSITFCNSGSQGLRGFLHDSAVYTYIFSLNSNWKRLLVIFAPLWPEKTNILSLQTATGKLQQEGGISPLCSIWKVIKLKIRIALLYAQLHMLRMLQGHRTQMQPGQAHGMDPVKLDTGNRLLLCLCVWFSLDNKVGRPCC